MDGLPGKQRVILDFMSAAFTKNTIGISVLTFLKQHMEFSIPTMWEKLEVSITSHSVSRTSLKNNLEQL